MSNKPEFFGKYILLEKIAVGGMAEVYLAKVLNAENIAKFVAIKRILPQHNRNQDFIEMFKEEAKIAVHLAQGNIVPIFEFGEEKGTFYLSMEYVEGRNLRQVVNRNKEHKRQMTIDQCVYVINEAARGLDHAHRCIDGTTGRPLNIIHRDISPQNIMVSFDGGVKIVDFGIAKAESKVDSTRLGTLKGKFSYMSPEQAEGQEVDFRTDIFSLGIVLWELLANERLFSANNEMNTLRKIRECQIPSLHKADPKISQDLEKICSKALARDRNLRYQSAADFQRDLSRFLNRQFPDFSPQDFSTAVKQVFADEIIETRRRLVEYSKITAANSNHSEEHTVLVDSTKTVTEADDESSNKNTGSASSGPKLETVSKTPMSLQSISGPTKLAIVPNSTKKTPSTPRLPLQVERPRSSPPKMQPQSQQVEIETESKSSFGLVGFLSLLILGASIWAMREEPFIRQMRCKFMNEACSEDGGSKKPPTIAAVPDVAAIEMVVMSQPPGAEIFVDGKTTTVFTPGKIRLQPKAENTLALRKDGYLTHSQKLFAPRQGESMNVTLVRADVGYISITVKPIDATIYINETELQEKLPITRYPVQANKKIKVRAYDPVTGASEEKSILVKANTNQDVLLYLSTKGTKRK